MTKREFERLAVVETQMQEVKKDIAEIKTTQAKGFEALNQKMDAFIEHSSQSFLTVAQAKLIGWIISFLLTLIGLSIAALNYIRGH